jgi:hypothetical protein
MQRPSFYGRRQVSEEKLIRLLSPIRRIVSAFAVTATLLWGFAGAVVPGHEMTGSPTIAPTAGIAASAHGGHGVDAASDSCDGNSLDGHGGGFDRCCLPGCAFSATTPAPSGIAFHESSGAPVLAPAAFVPLGSSAPPLRPPRVS